ncbi:hypothetical protein HPB52_023108 [Rhipicephalus sanguineus]|uniref:Brinker DNA-binding domain-containing protein n=1 Tax=Rhipicephalus sanguineus TaxID=34632 RepID=A0A9D4PFC0_RHISA|nr:hypothetical protein HPB52_023108 [Rhipicephalus sanguineus]
MAPNERSHYSAAYKRKVVLAAESSSNVQAGRDFGVDEKNVRRWRGQREKLFACAATRMTFTGPRKGRHPEMEAALADFVRTQRAAALPVTTEVLQATARALSREQVVHNCRCIESTWHPTCSRRNKIVCIVRMS